LDPFSTSSQIISTVTRATGSDSNPAEIWLIVVTSLAVVASALWLVFARNTHMGSLAIVFGGALLAIIIALLGHPLLAGIELFCIGFLCAAIVLLSDSALSHRTKHLYKFRTKSLLLAGAMAVLIAVGLILISNIPTTQVSHLNPTFAVFSAFLIGNYAGVILLQAIGLLLLAISIGVIQTVQ
jgi:NADH:ubiquinone oxidoreductase subunit 6 (subunit J)